MGLTGGMSNEDVDDLLERYLEGLVPMDAVKKSDCDDKHEHLDAEIEKALASTAKAVAAHLKVWILGSLLGIFLAGSGALVCGVIEIGQYKERVDATSKQLERQELNSNRQLEELKLEIRELRNVLIQQGRASP